LTFILFTVVKDCHSYDLTEKIMTTISLLRITVCHN